MIELSDPAVALWVRAGSYCAKHLTDGEVKRSTLRILGADRDSATELVLAGLWDAEGDVWRFHDWADYQPTKEKVLAEREATRQRVEKHRANRQRNSATNGVSTDAPSRPVPTRPLTDYVSQSNATDDDSDEVSGDVLDSISRAVLKGYDIDPDRLIAHIAAKTGRDVTPTEAKNVASSILERGGDGIAKPQAYVLGSITKSPAEVRDQIDASRPTSSSSRAPECPDHPHYPLPCDRCRRDAEEGG